MNQQGFRAPLPNAKLSESFKRRADGACFWEAWVAAVLSRAGLYTVHTPLLIDGKDHSQDCDLIVGVCSPDQNEPGTRVEVKSLSLTFSSPEDYPYHDVLVCSQASFLRKWPGKDYICSDFLLVSVHAGSIVWVPYGTKVELGREVFDRTRGAMYKAVSCRKVALKQLDDFIKEISGRIGW